MKKALNILITYIVFFIAGLVAGTLLYSCYLNLLNFVIGREIHFFADAELYQSVFYVAYCLILLICPFVTFYRIRHPGGVPQTIAYILICLINWGLLFPGVYKLNKICDRHFNFEVEEAGLTKGYFREDGDTIYYFTKDFEPDFKNYSFGSEQASAIIIDKSENGGVTYSQVTDDKEFPLNKDSKPYKEVLIKENFEETKFSVPIDFHVLINQMKKNYDNGIIPYLIFLTFGLVISTIYGVSTFFEWKLINTSLLFFASVSVYTVNSVYYLPILEKLKDRLNSNVVIDNLGNYIHDPLIFLINVLFALFFVITGIIKFIVHIHGKKNR